MFNSHLIFVKNLIFQKIFKAFHRKSIENCFFSIEKFKKLRKTQWKIKLSEKILEASDRIDCFAKNCANYDKNSMFFKIIVRYYI